MEISFDPADPFPLLRLDAYTLAEAQQHARLVDAWLGLRAEEIEADLTRRRVPTTPEGSAQDWVGLPVQSMLTPYVEIRSLLDELRPADGTTLIDLGAAYGRMAWVVGEHFPRVRFIGFEILAERVREGLRCLASCSYRNVQLIRADLSSTQFVLPDADFYFIYDFGTREAIEKTLQDLRMIARRRPIVVVGRGRASRDAIERSHPWLSEIVSPRHTPCFSIYKSA